MNMKKRALILLLACMMIATTGCDIPFVGGAKDEQEQEDMDDNDDDTDKDGWTSLGGESDDDEDLPKQIKYSYQSHPVSFEDEGDVLASGIYVTVELDDDARDEYPELYNKLQTYNNDAAGDVSSYLSSCEDEIRQMRSEGMSLGYEDDDYFHPQRSDEKAFSFIIESYLYCGGAHGTTAFFAHNIDPETGKDIKFSDVVQNTKGLPDTIVDELIRQNEDLEDYFEECPGDKENLYESLGVKLDDNAKDLVWTLCYDGIRIYFEDYALGSYAVGTRNVLIKFADYPEVFTDDFDDYANEKKAPAPDANAKALNDADTEKLAAAKTASAEPEKKTHEEKEAKEEISLSKDQRQKLNIFISNFAEQGFYGYDETSTDMYKIAEFAYRWTRINKPEDVVIDGSYYKLSYDKIKRLAKRYLGRDISDKDLDSYQWEDVKEEERFCRNGYYFAPAADGEYHTGFALTSFAYDNGDGTFEVEFMGYYMDLDAFWDNNETIPRSFYALTCDEANRNKAIEEGDYAGTATVRKDGDSYTLVSFYTY